MSEEQTTRYPAYVTDGAHVYLWNDHYAPLLEDGRLRESEPPEKPKEVKLSQREQTQIELLRKQALKDAENAVRILSAKTTLNTMNEAINEMSDESIEL